MIGRLMGRVDWRLFGRTDDSAVVRGVIEAVAEGEVARLPSGTYHVHQTIHVPAAGSSAGAAPDVASRVAGLITEGRFVEADALERREVRRRLGQQAADRIRRRRGEGR